MRKSIFIMVVLIGLCFVKAKAMTHPEFKKPDDRILVSTMVCDALGKIGNSQAENVLLDCLRNKDYFIRAYAAQALGRLKSKKAAPALKTLTRDTNYLVRIVATAALVKIGDPQAEIQLMRFLRDQDWTIRATAVSQLGGFGDRFKDLLWASLQKEQDARVRTKTLEQLAKLASVVEPSKEKLGEKPGKTQDLTLTALRQALEDAHWQVRQAACTTLASFGDRRSIPLLIERLGDESIYVRASAKEALGKLEETLLTKLFWDDIDSPEQILKASSFIALAYLGDPAIIPILLQEIARPDTTIYMRMKAAQALMLLKPKLPQALILALSTSKFREVLAAKCLGFTYQIKGKELVSIFTQALHDPNSPLYSDAPFVLKELREETIAQALREAMGNIDPNQVAACAYGLGELKDTAAVDGLTQILKMNCF